MRTSREKRKFLEILKGYPIVIGACKRVNIDKSTVYRWREKDKEFAKEMDKAMEDGRSSMVDVAENQLFKNIHEGDFKSVKFFLENNCKRYVKPRPINYFNSLTGISKKPDNNQITFVDMTKKNKTTNKD